jgi:hypothetical protein
MRNHRVAVLLFASCLAMLAMSFGASASAGPSGYPPSGYPPSGYPPSGYPPSGYPPSAGCTVSTSVSSVSPGAGSVSCSPDPTAETPQGRHHAAGSTAYTGFVAIIASVVALALLGGGVLFVFVGRGRRA